ncbi:family 20 glycosylhydrolase [Cohnella silvisoli]|uniref:Family 20 glycosylhydrolase n=1 Tax=Cohnella silvisoli TaxID=2873699 RepID=A0ABV1KYG4_9BACL|nr:family 20 glycosylhydrolase [Cohnella silvisoli]MCD9024231.1 beta-N-acetylhexosaminidase [Cohnella silvisoli]
MMEQLNRYERLEQEGAFVTSDTLIVGGNELLHQITMKVLSREKHGNAYAAVRFINRVDEQLQSRIRIAFGDVYKDDEDGYVIETDEDEVRVCAASIRGLVYGAYNLQQLGEKGFLRKGIIYNVPLCSFRGLKVYLPADEDIAFFKSFIDMACYYRYNTIVIEVGGAMEYRRHPEINEGWAAYCQEMREYSGKATEVQHGSKWEKNSIHCENGGGGWLSQATVRSLVVYCKERGLTVIPEVPCLSHCDYLLTRHPELAERKDDAYPDTFCPSNPASYALLFDVLDEVAEVFEPGTIHIGHDEFYSVGVCDECKDRDAAEIYAEDLKKIHDYLAQKGIHAMIWGDKLINCISKRGNTYGGSTRVIRDKEGNFMQFVPPTYKAIDRIPQDIRVMHWYWSMPREYDEDYLSRDMYMVYGNFEGPGIPEWSRRLSKGVQGASISNWSALREDYLQRNGIFFNMAYCCRMFWQEGYEKSMYAALAEQAFADLFRYKNRDVLSGAHIEITYATTFKRDYAWFFDGTFIEPDKDYLGDYKITFEDGSVITHPVKYGENISHFDRSWTTRMSDEFDVYEFDRSLIEVSYTTLPVREGSQTYYQIVLGNPFPEKKLVSLEFMPKKDLDACVIVQKVMMRD